MDDTHKELAEILIKHVKAAHQAMSICVEYDVRTNGRGAVITRRRLDQPSASPELASADVPSYMGVWMVNTPLRNGQHTGKILVQCRDSQPMRILYGWLIEEGYGIEATQVQNAVLVLPPVS